MKRNYAPGSAGKKCPSRGLYNRSIHFPSLCILSYYTTPTSKSSCASTHLIHPTSPPSGKQKKCKRINMVPTYKKIWLVYSKTAWSSLRQVAYYPSIQWIWCRMKGRTNEGWPDIKNKLNITVDHNIISLMIKRTNITKHMMTSTVAHITIPPFFWVRSACMSHKPNAYHRGKEMKMR